MTYMSPGTLRVLASVNEKHLPTTAEQLRAAADEIDRLRKMLIDHGINPDGEYIALSGLRVDAPASKIQPDF